MSDSVLVTLDNFSTEITPDEYSTFIKREKELSYINEATFKDGVPVDVDDYIQKGIDILSEVWKGEHIV
ncbi:hypothetical protein R80B4_02788 [Fibrobacteres bacterium R8-0-B4]